MGVPFYELLKYSKRQRQAAKELWANVKSGISFEVPTSLSTDDDTMKALELMCKQHPEVVTGAKTHDANGAPITLQSRGIVVGLRSSIRASPAAKLVLSQYGYMPDAHNLIELFQSQEAFIKQSGGLTPEEAVKQAQLESKERNRVVLPSQAEDRAATDAAVKVGSIAPLTTPEPPKVA